MMRHINVSPSVMFVEAVFCAALVLCRNWHAGGMRVGCLGFNQGMDMIRLFGSVGHL